jgi:hypothetical protein
VNVTANGSITGSWGAKATAERYRVDVLHPDGIWRHKIQTGNTGFTYTANGIANTTIHNKSNRSPSGILYSNKCMFEIKTVQNLVMERFIMEHSTPGSGGSGYAWWIKSNNNSAGSYMSAQNWTKNLLFRNGIVRHCAGFLRISGREHEAYEGGVTNHETRRPRLIENVEMHDILVWDSGGSAWNQGVTSIYAIALNNGGKDLNFHHLTILHNQTGFMSIGSTSRMDGYLINLQMHSILARANTYGIKGGNSLSTAMGTPALDAHARGYTLTNITLENSKPFTTTERAAYPAGIAWLSVTDFKALFANYDNGGEAGFELATGSPALTGGLGGTRQGANVTSVRTATATVIAGTTTVAPTPSITTAPALPSGRVSVAYPTITINVSGGVEPVSVELLSGTLPAGLTLNGPSRTISGQPTGPAGIASFSLRPKGADNTYGNAVAFTLDVQPAPTAPITIGAQIVPPISVGVDFVVDFDASGGTGNYTWTLGDTSGPLPVGLLLDPLDGRIFGSTSQVGEFPITLEVSDGASTAQQAITLVVTSTSYSQVLTAKHDQALAWNISSTNYETVGDMIYFMAVLPYANKILDEFNAAQIAALSAAFVPASIPTQSAAKETLNVVVPPRPKGR